SSPQSVAAGGSPGGTCNSACVPYKSYKSYKSYWSLSTFETKPFPTAVLRTAHVPIPPFPYPLQMKRLDRYLVREMFIPFLIGQCAVVLMLTGTVLYNNAATF